MSWCIKVWRGPHTNTRHSREVPWQLCEWELAQQAVTNQHCHTEGTSVHIYLTRYLRWSPTVPMRGGDCWRRVGAEVAKWETKAVIHKAQQLSLTLTQITLTLTQIWWPKQWTVQGSYPQRFAEQTTAIMTTRVHMQARQGKASPCRHPTDYRDCWMEWLKIDFA